MAAAIAAMAVAVTKVEAAVIRAVVVGTKAVPKTEKTTAIKVVEVVEVTKVAEAAAATKAAVVATKDASETMRENALAELLSDLPSRSAKSVPKEGTTNSASTRLSILAKAVLPGGDAPSSP
jgi:hypothetical protein